MERLARLVVLLAVAAGVISGGVALAANGGSNKPGKGCGDKHHTHYKEEHGCKKPPKHHGK
jgi:hypothetical protein